MSPERNNPERAASGVVLRRQTAPGPAAEADARFAHELANLVDGSMRNIGLVLASLRDLNPQGMAAAEHDEEVLRRLEAANGALRHMSMLVRQWARSPQKPPRGGRVQTVQEVIDEVAVLLTPMAAGRGIAVLSDVSPEAAGLPGEDFHPVLTNTVRNSIEAIASAGDADRGRTRAVCVRIRTDGPDIVIRVMDDGPGIAPALIEGDRFRFGVSTKPDGHGIGLSICLEVARQRGGRIEFRNRPDGTGSLFEMRCPIVRPEDAPSGRPSTA